MNTRILSFRYLVKFEAINGPPPEDETGVVHSERIKDAWDWCIDEFGGGIREIHVIPEKEVPR